MAGELIDLLRRVPLFCGLGEDALADLADVVIPRGFAAGEVVFRAGEVGDTCYIVRSGEARAIHAHGDGRSITLAHFRAGDMFGELAMFDSERRSATVDAVQDTQLVAILAADMRRLLELHPGLAIELLVSLGNRLRETNERLARQSFQTVPGRVAATLSQLVPAQGTVIASTQADLARMAGCSRESVSRFLAVLERAGIISQGRGKVTVHDGEALERYVY